MLFIQADLGKKIIAGRVRSDSASHCWISGRCCQNPLPGWVRSGSRGGQGDAGHCRQRRLKTSLSAPIGRRREEPQVPLPAFTRHPAQERPRRGDHISLSAFCSTNKDDDLSSVPGPRHGHPGLSPSHWSALTSAAAVVITRVKGRFYYSHGRANALIQRHGIVPSGWRREEGRNLSSTCWKGFKADFTPSTGGPGEQGRTESGWREPPGRSREGEMLLSALLCFSGVCCPGQDSSHGMGVGGTKKVTITLFLLVLFLTTFLFLFVYFVVSLLLSVFLVLLGKTKHHLKKYTGEGRRGKRCSAEVRVPTFPALSKAPAQRSPRYVPCFLPASTRHGQPRHEGSSLE